MDAEGYAYVTGLTESTNFPTTSDSIQNSNPDANAAFITKLGLTGKSLVSSTYFGGNGAESASGLAMDSSGNVYIAGSTTSTNLTTSTNAFQATYPGTINTLTNTYNTVGFVSKVCIEKNRDEAPDATPTGPSDVTPAEYRLSAALDPTVLDLTYPGEDLVPGSTATGRETEIWGQMYRPTTLPAGPSPLLILLHGNHDTCGKKNTTPA
ncbi:MAG TPA: SBBP repeat-containing protein [Pyrinomonadaceae bacterium]